MIYLLKENFINIDFTGIDISKDLINMAKKEIFLDSVKFIQDDISTFSLKENFDIVIMSGVLSIFDDFEKILLNVLNHMKKESVGFIFGAFNKADIDVIIRYRNNYIESNEWESGWNLFSLKRITDFLESHSKGVEIIKFNLKQEIKKKKNPVSSYTVKLQNDSNLIVTGGGVIRDFYLIKFIKK
ncbi:MAG: class I SAM-dependent methyltransferase [Flavobacteriaceae bacterium]|nr:class I SAM-dependent methyltransferase [Flavobacteriaceae bacterium]MBT6353352.1 class I SAM-dependent methyltransferase [Pelagibacteraceae bacterium]MBT7623948.1 class I SAM-dependent methyltransferase [Flavobacteriaceae bacterium]